MMISLLTSHFAFRVLLAVVVYILHHVIISFSSVSYHHINVAPTLIGSGNTIFHPLLDAIADIVSHQLGLNVMVKSHDDAGFTSQLASTPHLHG